MNTKKRSLALLLAVLYAVTLLTGCSSAEMALYEASLKNAEMLWIVNTKLDNLSKVKQSIFNWC